MPSPAPIRLSKSKFVAGIQCLKRLYFQVQHPELADEAGEGQIARREQGDEIGLLAQKRFPGGTMVAFEDGTDDALAKTAALLDDPSCPAIYEATFRHSNVLVWVDILQRRPGNRWRLIEVKSSLDVKEHFVYDLAIQYHVLTQCGLDISSACLMHLNRDYCYDGERHDLLQLFTIKNLTKQIRKLDADLPRLLKTQRDVLARATAPDITPGPQCTAPYQCEFYGHCNPKPPEHHISYLPNLRTTKQDALVRLGVTYIHEIPSDFPLTDLQTRVRTTVTSGETWVSPKLQKELGKLKYPLYFMDFESLYPGLPRFAGMKPYAQIPFQWSVHRQLERDVELE
jgi:hypothetical protein